MKLSEEQIKEIAEELDAGMRCYFNLKTGEIRSMIDLNRWAGADEEPWEEVIKEIEDHWDDYHEFEAMDTHDSFSLMADFATTVDNDRLQNKLINALNRPKPFANFKWEIDNSGDYRQQWFDFKKERYMEWVREQIEDYNRSIE
jgi:hypothetical protein